MWIYTGKKLAKFHGNILMRLVPKSVTLNDLERLRNFSEFVRFLGGLRKSG